MPTTDKRIDAYIAKSGEFARPILKVVRETVHEACPDCDETLKWSSPAFLHNGKIIVMAAAFKQHAAVRFWRGGLVVDDSTNKSKDGAGQFGRLTKVSDLPPKKKFIDYIRKSMALNAGEREVPKRSPTPKKELEIPLPFLAAIKKNKRALAAFEKFAPSHRREYIEWVSEAKREETRDKRIAQAVEQIAEGKSRHWKYK